MQEVAGSIPVSPRFFWRSGAPPRRKPKTAKERAQWLKPVVTCRIVKPCLISSVRQSVRLLIDWPRVRSPHGVLLFGLAFVLYFSFPPPAPLRTPPRRSQGRQNSEQGTTVMTKRRTAGTAFGESSSSLVVMTSALHAEGREFNPPLEYFSFALCIVQSAPMVYR